jgi:hypothetical protein
MRLFSLYSHAVNFQLIRKIHECAPEVRLQCLFLYLNSIFSLCNQLVLRFLEARRQRDAPNAHLLVAPTQGIDPLFQLNLETAMSEASPERLVLDCRSYHTVEHRIMSTSSRGT